MGLTLVWIVEMRSGESEEFWEIHHTTKRQRGKENS